MNLSHEYVNGCYCSLVLQITDLSYHLKTHHSLTVQVLTSVSYRLKKRVISQLTINIFLQFPAIRDNKIHEIHSYSTHFLQLTTVHLKLTRPSTQTPPRPSSRWAVTTTFSFPPKMSHRVEGQPMNRQPKNTTFSSRS